MLLIASCGKGPESAQPPSDASSGAGAQAPAGEPPGGTKAKPEPVTVKYYVANDRLDGLLEREAVVEPEEPSDTYRLAMEALKRGDESAGELPLWKNAVFRRVELAGGVLIVDVSLPGEARLGSMGEALAIEAIARTAFQFEEVSALEILVDGEQADSLMGHEELAHPIVRAAYPDEPDAGTAQALTE